MTAGHGTYALLDLWFLLVVAVVGVVAAVVAVRRAAASGGADAVADWRLRTFVTGVVAGVVLLVMTIVFDNVIVGTGIVAYDPALISGLHLGFLPIEDLAYAIAAVVFLPSVWVLCTPAPARPDARRRGPR
jgi:lycopene cyclase domain-containing protein